MKLEDDSPVPFGKYKGQPMQDVPVNYLHWCWNNTTKTSVVGQYIKENMDALKEENEDLIWDS